MTRFGLFYAAASGMLGCRPCYERCAGSWTVTIGAESTLADGVYEVVVTPEAGPPQEGVCTVSQSGSSTECEGQLRARGLDGAQMETSLEVEVHEVGSTQTHVLVIVDGTTVVEEMYPVEYEDNDSCNPHCRFATVFVSL